MESLPVPEPLAEEISQFQTTNTSEPFAAADNAGSVRSDSIRLLMARGFSRNLAEKLVEHNLILFAILAEENPRELESQLNQIAKLKDHPSVWTTLQQFPEVAGLMAKTLEFCERGPERINAVLSDPKNRRHFLNFCHFNTLDIRACLHAADQYMGHGSIIVKLYEQGHTMPLPETFFMDQYRGFSINPEAEKVYNQWVGQMIENALRLPAEEKHWHLQTIYESSLSLRETLDQNVSFRDNFRHRYFPIIERVANYHRRYFDLPMLLNAPDIWEIVQRPDAERLLQMHGLDAPAILQDFKGSTAAVQRKVNHAMLTRNEGVIFALNRFNDTQELENLLNRKIGGDTLVSILEEQAYNPIGLDRLRYYNSLSDVALLDDLYPYDGWLTFLPGYYTYKVVQKTIRGQEVAVIEIIFAIADPVFVAIEIVLIVQTAGGSAALASAIRVAAKTAATRVAWQAMQNTAGRGTMQTINFGGRQAAQDISKTGVEGAFRRALSSAQGYSPILQLDITPLVRTTFEQSRMLGMRNDNFKKLSGLDARAFMRNDRRVVLDLGKLNNTLPVQIAQVAGIDVSARIGLESEPVQEFAVHTKDFVAYVWDKATETHKEVQVSWEEYASALWLMSATGALGKKVEKIVNEQQIGEMP